MKNITAQYRDLLEGKMTKANFMANVRMQFPDYISPVNSYEDMVKILKSKRILSEIGDLDKTTAQLDAQGDKKAFYLVDETGDVIDSVMAVDSQEATDYFEREYEGIGSSLTVVHTDNPDELRGGVAEAANDAELEEAKGYKDPYVKGYIDNQDGYALKDCPYEDPTDAELWKDGWLDYESEKQMAHDEDTFRRETGDHEYEDIYRESLNEAVEKPEGSYKKVTGKDLYSFFNEIDRVNPYEVKKGIAIEMGMQYQPVPNYFTDDFNPESLAKATRKVLKNLQKDPAYYTNMISLPTEKRTNMLQKPAEVKVKADGHTKIKGFADTKGNTEENLGKKERAKGSPEGVKEMKPSKKSMGGLKTMKSNDKLPKGVELMKEADLTSSPAGLNAVGTSDLANRAKVIYAQEEFDRLMQGYDWYYEMSDSPKVYDRGVALDDKLKKLAKVIGAEKALEIFNRYAPANRKQDASFFAETIDMKAKLKELVMQEVKKRMSERLTTTVPKGSPDAVKAAAITKAQTAAKATPGTPIDVIEK